MPHSIHTPADLVASWSRVRPVVALVSGGHGQWSRHHRVAEPISWRVAHDPTGALDLLDSLTAARPAPRATGLGDGWIVAIDYELGGAIEPRAASRHEPGPFPLACAARIEGEPELDGPEPAPEFTVGAIRSAWGRAGYQAAVARAIEYIRAGDGFQVNLAHSMSGDFSGSARGLFAELIRAAEPWFGAYIELPPGRDGSRRVIASASPELFIDADLATRRVLTRPMKGTRRAGLGGLARSDKDAAELHMIVDLMRNDLGRICRTGSIAVDDPRAIERHGAGLAAIDQGVATVRGELRQGVGLGEIVRAAFPPGSVTGAPKIRAMQIIDELEPDPRGPYCGCIGWIGDDGRLTLSVAIRTAIIEGLPADAPGAFERARVRFPIGAGIVAQSTPDDEWEETLVKASAFEVVLARAEAAGAGRRP